VDEDGFVLAEVMFCAAAEVLEEAWKLGREVFG